MSSCACVMSPSAGSQGEFGLMTSKPLMPSGVMPVACARPVRSIWSVMIFRLMASDIALRCSRPTFSVLKP